MLVPIDYRLPNETFHAHNRASFCVVMDVRRGVMSKSENRNQNIQLKMSEVAFYADISDPRIQRWLQRGILETLPRDQIYLSTCAGENRNVMRNLLSSRAKAIFVIGNDACFEHFFNLYRELNPNPSRAHYLGFVPPVQSQFASRFGLGLSASKLPQLESMSFLVCMLSLPELHSQLALHIGVGHLLSSFRYIPQFLSRQLLHTPLARPLPGLYAMTCLNEAPDAYAISPQNTILRTLSKDQILFSQRVLTMRILPSLLTPPGLPETCSHYFELRVRTFVGRYFFPIRYQTEAFLCQRVKLEFAQPAMLHTCSGASEVSSLSITLSGRMYPCLVPCQPIE